MGPGRRWRRPFQERGSIPILTGEGEGEEEEERRRGRVKRKGKGKKEGKEEQEIRKEEGECWE